MGGKPRGLLKTFRTAHRLSSRLEMGNHWEGHGTDTSQIRHSRGTGQLTSRGISLHQDVAFSISSTEELEYMRYGTP
jgi:hypothetical protein